ncbi:hypothetical protein RhiirA5_435529 [Rhizophagus irregularis]|uniref:Uncharacterized protein n=1 Tax=Rhizophagus irregularis TaxID=588596 RepID=A0A2I1EAJ0_9GLOM|nr:hypothetical protein RhiirA5_435529 [Rhizophagus irregularis]PKC64719.1 hypothetical protein RhiirA1_462035 [Rhizophagus irregularis]PKY19139.1 hypothetical protein RhiirB3_432139 [Rhizophagus irregularis]CAB4496043.1 unnamed protein product [Rhizophagus irregularis]CAB5395684.1 unnamed protein product [Rhizophagus irregularis]
MNTCEKSILSEKNTSTLNEKSTLDGKSDTSTLIEKTDNEEGKNTPSTKRTFNSLGNFPNPFNSLGTFSKTFNSLGTLSKTSNPLETFSKTFDSLGTFSKPSNSLEIIPYELKPII